MTEVINVFRTVIAVILSVFTSFFAVGITAPQNAAPEEDVTLSAAILSDTHITKELYRKVLFTPGLKNISKLSPDLFIVDGDCTDNGNEENWQAFQDLIDKHLTVEHRLIVLGNHDTWTSYDTPHDYAPARENFVRFSNAIMGEEGAHDEVYYTYTLNGIHFIVLGSEGTGVGEDLSDAQLDWFEGAMADAAAHSAGKPIIVLNHQALNFTHTVGDDEHGMGIDTPGATERLIEIMDQYKNVLYFSGHLHYGLNTGKYGYPEGFTTVEKVGENITSVNLPSYTNGSFISGGNALIGTGIYMQVTADKVILLGRNFLNGTWIPDFNVEIPLQ
ncbi:MAG: metallophosphoesterase [Clostridia bacterium]|nr:metallophosphoesterase [Clostridia bacterium]MBR0510145.1 metallophosphoesterase [Clostridia bacterium]